MAVMIGSARIDERGRATGGKAGDQTGNEVGRQSWYKHSKGWRVLRPKDQVAAARIAQCMEWACDNSHIGYDQAERLSLYKAAEPHGFDVSQVEKNVETDCSALVRVCCAYAGIGVKDFITSNEASVLLNSGAFTEMTGARYTDTSEFLRRGDVLVTKTKGHTVVVLTNGTKADKYDNGKTVFQFGDRVLRNGCLGPDVAVLQTLLIHLGYSCGSWGPDGDFGDATELAVRHFQRAYGLSEDGICASEMYKALEAAQEEDQNRAEDDNAPKIVRIVGGDCWARYGPGKEHATVGVAYEGDRYMYKDSTYDGWNLINFKGTEAWVSGKYSRVL